MWDRSLGPLLVGKHFELSQLPRMPRKRNPSTANFRLSGYSEVRSVSSPKNGYMAYKKIAIWQTHLLHTRP
jgi:hypothetical protein